MTAIYSMTGFATGEGRTEEGTGFTLTLKSVNHRFLDLALRLPPGCDGLEMALRGVLKGALRRGHVEVTVQLGRREGGTQLQLNEELLSGYVAAYQRVAERYGVMTEPDLNGMLRQPGVLRMEAAPAGDAAALPGAVLEVLPEMLARFQTARGQEGASLATELRAAMLRLRAMTAEVAALRAGVRDAQFTRLRARMEELLQGSVPEERLLAEAAMLAERSDIDEELVRLQTHGQRFMALLEEGGELGKRLDFLLQELNREANTLLSKSTGAASGLRITELGLEMKLEIEKAREQVQNLE